MERANHDLPRCIEASGPLPFITHRVYEWPDGSRRHWYARHHRKGLIWRAAVWPILHRQELLRSLWMPDQLNWWIGVIFAIGASLFALASGFVLLPDLAAKLLPQSISVNGIYFAGSIPFTCAAYLQLYQSANAAPLPDERPKTHKRRLLGWKPIDAGWLSCALQFGGTILFNFNTFDAMLPGLNWFQQDLLIWVPNLLGSVLFLASGYLAFIEMCPGYWAWNPGHISWWVVFVNLLGCGGFMISALLSIVLPEATEEAITQLAVLFTLQGACCFLLGALLMLPETSWQLEQK